MSSNDFLGRLQELRYDLHSIAHYRVFPLLLETVLITLVSVLVVFSASMIWRKESNLSDAKRTMIVVTWTMYILSCVVWAVDIRILWQEFSVIMPQRLSDTAPTDSIAIELSKVNSTAELLRNCCWYCILLFGDAIVLWRAYAIWGRPRWLRLVSCFIMLIDLGAYAFSALFYAVWQLDSSTPNKLAGLITTSWQTVGFVLPTSITALSSVMATALIAYKSWIHRREVISIIHEQPVQTRKTLKILTVFVETGIVYSVFWTLSIFGYNWVFGMEFWYFQMSYIVPLSAMYPTLVVALVAREASVLEDCASRARATNMPKSTFVSLRFAVPSTSRAESIGTAQSSDPEGDGTTDLSVRVPIESDCDEKPESSCKTGQVV